MIIHTLMENRPPCTKTGCNNNRAINVLKDTDKSKHKEWKSFKQDILDTFYEKEDKKILRALTSTTTPADTFPLPHSYTCKTPSPASSFPPCCRPPRLSEQSRSDCAIGKFGFMLPHALWLLAEVFLQFLVWPCFSRKISGASSIAVGKKEKISNRL